MAGSGVNSFLQENDSLKLLLLFFSLSALPAFADWFTYDFDVMGTRASIELWGDSQTSANQLFNLVEQEMRRVEGVMSPYIAESELSKINRSAASNSLKISTELYEVIKKSLAFSEKTDGLFDVSFASVGYMYDYRKGIKPGDRQLSEKLDAVDYKSILLDDQSIKFLKEGMRIDLGGIAKGYAVDRSIAILQQHGIESAIVSAGGDSRIIGNRGQDKKTQETLPWVIGIRHPREKNKQALRLPLIDTAVSTSGDYERFFIEDGQRYHHIIHPATGKSTTGVVSATVIGPQSIDCDALSTSVFTMGVEEGLALIEMLEGYDAIVIDSTGKVHYSSGLMP